MFLGVSKIGAGLSFSKFLFIKDGLSALKSLLSISEKFLSSIESGFSIFKVLFSLSDIGLSTSLVEKGKIEFIFSIIKSFIGLFKSVGGIFSVSVSFGSVGSSFIGSGFSSNELDVNSIIDSLSGGNFSFSIIHGGEGIKELLISSNLLSLDSLDVINEGNFVGNGDFVEGVKSSISTGDGNESFSSVSGLIGGFNTNGVDSGDGEGTDKRSSFGVSNNTIREVLESKDCVSDVMFSGESISELLSNINESFVSSAGDDSEGVDNFSSVVVISLSSPDFLFSRFAVDDIEDVLSVGSMFSTSDFEIERPSSSDFASSGDDSFA